MTFLYRYGIATALLHAVLKTYCLLISALLFLAPLRLFGEGSKELNQSGGYRPYLNSTSTASSLNPFPTLGTVKVYVNVGERIYMGSSAQGIGNGRINVRAPNGQTYTSGNSTTTGRISSRSQEVTGPSVALLDGGYTPYIITVGAGQAGVWEIDFVSPNATNAANPNPILSSANWTQPTNSCYIAAFDVSIRNAANNFVTGRAYTNVFTANLGAATSTFNAVLDVLTNDGYIYTVNNNGQAGYGFSFLANNKGFRNADGSPTYKSIDDLNALNLKDPRTQDTETDITHKIFFNTPSASLPASAPSISGTEWLLTTPPALTVSNITFRGVEGTANTAGTNPAGGYISFTASNPSNFNIDIDINANGSYTDAVDKRLTGTAVSGTNTAYWDGTNGQGAKVLSGSNTYNTRVTLLSGEVHFPFIDVENNPNGIIITRVNGSGAPNNIVYWDDSGLAGSGTPSSPLKTGVDGISSATNGHKFGSTAYSGTDFGNENGLDTWAYLQSTPTVQALSIVLREADLETVSINKTPTAICEGQPITYTVAVRNNGPGNVSGAAYRFTFPATLTNVSVSSAVTTGTASVTGGAVSGNQYTATLNMNNAAVITFTITGTVSAFPAGGSLSVTSAVMRPSDVTDPDATNPDASAPTDPQLECDAAPSGTGCNNIKTDITTVSQLPTTANAGPAQVLCAATTAALAGNTPTVGTGAWSRISGPGNPVITNAASAGTTVTGLTTGVHVFRWTISNGSCTASTSDVQITVQAALAGNTVAAPAAVTYCGSGDPAAITGAAPTGGSGTYTYQWQQSADNITFTDISGATSASYDPPVLTATAYFRRQVTSGSCTTASSSNVVAITIQPAISVNTITAPATSTFCGSGDAALITGSTPAGGSGTYTYQWQSSLDNSNWSNLTNATAQSYDPVPVGTTVYYRRLVSSGACTTPAVSNVVTIAVTPALSAGGISGAQSFCVSGDPAAFTETSPPAGGTDAFTYQWQQSTDNTTFTNITGATAAVYDAPAITQTTYYRRIARSGVCADAVSNVIAVTVNPALTAGAIAASQSFCGSGDPAAFTVATAPTGGTGTYTYQWQSSITSASSGFADIAGASGATYDAPSLSQTTYFRRITRSASCAEAISNVATVTVLAGISNNVIDNAQTICTGTTPAAFTGTAPAGGSGAYTYLWESSTGSGAFAPAPGINNGQNYTPPAALTQTTSYRRTVTSAGCASSTSNIIQVTVSPAATVANAGADQGPTNEREVQLAGNIPSAGTGAWTQVSGPNTAGIVSPSVATTSVTGLAPGNYVFRWTISNPPCASSSDEVQIAVNAAPAIVSDVANTNEDVPVDISVLSNDTDSDGTLNAGSITVVNQPANGTLTVSAAGVVTYTPRADYNGNDVFSYTVLDNLGTVSNVATVSITITPVSDPPIATDDQINVLEDVTTNIPAPGVLDNDRDSDGGQLTTVIVTPVSNGTLTLNGDGSLSYTPPANFNGNAVFTYRVCDASGNCDTATVTLAVGNENDIPVANSDNYTADEDNVLNVPAATGLLANDTDADNDPLTANLVTAPASGTLVLNADGSFRYVPAADFNGPVSFVYRACDGSGACDTATVNLTVNNVNDAPVASNDEYSVNEDVPLTVAANGVLTNDSDIDGNPLTAAVVAAPASGTLTLNADGSFVYTPVANFNGIARFTYRVCDNGTPQLCDTAEVTITIRPVNDTVAANNDTYTTAEDVPLTVAVPGVLANDTDAEGDGLIVTLVQGPANGTLALNAEGNFAYTPNTNYSGTDAFVYRVCDPQGACDTATATINITPVNDAPGVNDINFTGTEDAPLLIGPPGLISTAQDQEGGTLTASLVTGPGSGTVTVGSDGSFTYTPPADFNGTTSFTFRVCDDGTPALCDTATATITIGAVNDAPAGADDSYTTTEDTPLTIAAPGVLANDTDPDGNPLAAAVLTQPANGTLTLNANGGFTYTPRTDFNGADSYTYRICDNNGGCDTATVTLNVTAANDTPIVSPINYTATEDIPLTIGAPGIILHDYDPDGDPMTVTLLSGPGNGTVVVNPNGGFTYTPAADFNGSDTFYYRVCDPSNACDTGSVVLTVQAVNDAPAAVNDTYTVNEDDTLTVATPGILANDTDPESDPLTATVLTPPVNGQLMLNGNGSLEYVPGADFNGADSFTYIACDANGLCDTATVNITVTAENDAPVAASDIYNTSEDVPLSVPAGGVLFNDADPDGSPLTATLVTPPASGTLVLNPDGSFLYTPAANFNGTATFTYQACDNGTPQLCSTGTVSINVSALNDPPNGVDDTYTLSEDSPLTITSPGLLSNDTDPDDNPLQVSGIYRQPSNGTITLNADGSFTYVPRADYTGIDSFAYNVCDNNIPAACDTAVVRLTITADNDAPRLVDDNYSTQEDLPLTITPPGLLFNDTDPDGNPVTVSGYVVLPANGSATFNANGSFIYTPAPNFQGLDSFTYRACDPSGACDTATVRIVVSPVNDPPVTVSESYTVPEDTRLSATVATGVLANDSDPDGDDLIAVLEQAPLNGSLTLNPDGSFVYLPYTNYNGSDLFTSKVCDVTGACVIDTVYLTITPVNDTVIARNDLVNTPEDVAASGNAANNDDDPEDDALTYTLLGTTANGTITLNADGTFTYNETLDFNGLDTAVYQVCDPSGACDTALIIINVGEQNDPPTGTPDSYTVNEDEILTVPAPGILSNDTDPDTGTQLHADLVSTTTNGTLILQADGSFTYQPNLNFNGSDQFTYNVCDANEACVPVVVSITITPVNDAPFAINDTAQVDEDTPLSASVLGNDSDTEANVLTVSLVAGPASGSISLAPDGNYTYTPSLNFNGTDMFQYRICDNGTPSLCDTATVVITINTENDPPVAAPDQYTVNEDNILNMPAAGVLNNDFDGDGDVLTAIVQTSTANGTLTVNSNGAFNYRPNRDFNGVDSFSYRACDPSGTCDTVTVRIIVSPVNDAPVAVDDYFARSEDTVITFPPIVALINDYDVDGDTLSGRPFGTLTKGTYTSNPDGTYTYRPAPDFFGIDSIQYQVCDGKGLCDTGIIRLEIVPRNDVPVANPDAYDVQEDITLNIPATAGVLVNDTDVDGEPLVSVVVNPANGSLQLNQDGSFTYRSGNNYNGADTFTYRACDVAGACDTALVVLTVLPVNDAPVAINDRFARNEDTVLTFPPSVALINDIDPDGDPLGGRPFGTLTKGTYTSNPDGTYTYRPLPNFHGLDSIQYQVCDPGGLCDTGTIVLEILPVNDKPFAVDDAYSVSEDSTLAITGTGIQGNDADVDGDALAATVLIAARNGTFTLNPAGSFAYVPNANYAGPDSVIYSVCDVAGACDTAVIRITVQAVSDPPVPGNDNYTTAEDTPLTIAAPGLLINDSDPDGFPLVASLAQQAQHGTVTLNPDGSFTYTPDLNFNGRDVFTYQVCDTTDGDQCVAATATIDVSAVNDAPVANVDAYSLNEDTVLAINTPGVLSNDGNIDNDVLQTSLITAPANGSLQLNQNGSFTYTPNANFNGADSALYSTCDPYGLCDTAVIRLTVNATNDRPIAVDDQFTRTEDTILTFPTSVALLNDTDPDGDPLTGRPISSPANGSYVQNPDGTYTYTPNPNFNGIDSVQYEVCDPFGGCDSAWIRLILVAVNDAPVAQPDNYQTDEDIVLSVPSPGVDVNDTDVDGDMINANVLAGTLHGTVTINADQSFTYVPDPGFNGVDSFTYIVCDPGGLCDTSVARITVNAVNDVPVALNNVYAIPEDSSVSANVLDNDTDPDGDPISASLLTNTTNGTLTINSDGTFTYVPNPGFNGTDGATYRVCDNGTPALCDTALISFIVTAVNDAPIAVRDSVDVDEDTPATGNVLTNDSDPEGDGLTASLVTAPVNGTVVLNADGSFTYTPNVNYNGADSLVYQVCDNGTPSLCDTATVVFNVAAVNDNPIAVRDSVDVDEDTPATGNVLTNDSDPEGDGLTASLVTAPVNGTVVLNADGSFTYTPNVNYNGADSLVYQVCDNGTPSLCDTVTVVFNVSAVNDNPIAIRDSVDVDEDTPATGNVLTNDSDPEGDGLTASLVTAPVNGTVVLNVDGSFTYTPNANYNGADSLVYQVCDNGTPSLCDTATVVFNVTAVNDNPIAVRDSVDVDEDTPATGNVLTNDSDPEGDALTASLVTAPVNGTVVLNADGSFTYTPNANYNGLDSLIYQVCDNGTPSLCDTATVVFNVSAVNDNPIAVRDSVDVDEDTPATGNVLTNDNDPEGDALTVSLVTAPVNGTVVLNADGSFTYMPNANYNGLDSVIYHVCDNGTPSLCDTATVVFNVAAVNDNPIAVRDSVDVDEDTPATGNVLNNDSDPEGDALTASLVTAPANGTVVLNADGSFTYTPNTNYNGPDSLIYQVCDNGTPSLCDTATVVFNVSAVNDNPIAVRDSVDVDEDTPATGNVLTNDSDPEGDGLTASLVTAPVNGTVVLNADGSFTYTPNTNYNGPDSLIYQVCDNGTPSLCDTATVVFNVAAVNDNPIAVRDSVEVDEDVPATGNVLTNDNDPEGEALTASLVTAPVNGTVVLNADGSFTYTPNANYNGLDSVIYQVCDNGTPSLCDTATVVFNVAAVNDNPIAVRDSVDVDEDVPATGNVLTNDSDPEGDGLTASLVTAPVSGTVVLNADGSFTYTPNANYNGLDSVIYKVCDNGTPSLCDTATVVFNVAAVNDNPIAVRDSVDVDEDVPATGNVLTNDNDPEGEALTASLVTAPVNGMVVLNADGSFTYTPNANFNGTDSLVYQVCDNGTPSLCDTAAVVFNVAAVNDNPVAIRDSVDVDEDVPATGNVLTNDSDPEGDALTTSLVTAPVNGTVVLNADGSFTYTPNTNYNGPDSLIYQVCDNGTPSLCDSATVVFNVAAVNDNPVAVRDSVEVDEDVPATGNVLTNDSDPEGDALTASLVTAPFNGTVVLNTDGSFTYTPNANYNGLDSVIYQVCDNGTPSLCDTATVVFNVAAVNDNPIAVRDSVDVDEDTPATGNVLTNDSDPEGDALTASLVTAPVNGTVVLNADGSFTYTPNINYNGPDSLIYQVCDNGTPSLCDTATVVFNVSAVNDNPIAVRDSVDVDEDVPATGNVLTNDSDPEGDALTASLVTAPVNGTVVLNADGSFTYTPNTNYNGPDSLIYQVCDNGTPSLCDTATVVFNVSAVNDSPIAVGDSVDVDEDTPATGNVLTNDSDPEGDALTASLVTAPVNGTVVLNADGSFTYTPNANYNGADSLVYQVCDNGTPSLCDTATVVFNVSAVNDNPIAVRDSVDVDEDTPATGNVLTNDSDPEGDALTASLVTAPVNGTVVLNADGSFAYTPNTNYNGADSLVYQVCDNGTPSLCDTATVVFNVSAVNDNPIAVRDSVDVDEDIPATGNVLTNDSDPEGDALTASLVTAPVNGTVVLNADGSFTYTPNVNYNGPDSLIYQVCDNGTPSLCDTATVVFNVTAVNDNPIAVRDSVDVDEDTPATGNVLTNDSDPEGDALTASLVTAPVNGTVVLNTDGSFTYTPNANYNGPDSLIYQVCDNGTPSLCDTATVVFNVSAVNDNPIAVRDSVDVDEDVPATGNVLTNDSDPEGDALAASLVTAPVNGTVVLNADGSFTYTPNANYNGADSLVYQVCDNGTPSLCDTATVVFNVSVVNDNPIAVRDSVDVDEDTPATGNVLTNDSDPEGDALTASLVTAPVNGTVVLNADGSFTYTPNTNYNGPDSLIYQVCDNGTPSLCDTATVVFNVTAVNDNPIAVRGSVDVDEDTPATGNVLTNDSDPEGDALTASLVTAPVNGTVVLNADGSFTYTPNVNYNGPDSLIYQVCDNGTPSLCDTATVVFNVTAANDSPIAVRDSVDVDEDVPASGNVLTNDSDPEGDALTASLVTAPVNGTVVLNADGSFTYTPNTNYNGPDSLIYQVCDNGTPSLCDTATVVFNVAAVNDNPIAVRDSVDVDEDTPATGNVLTNDSDPEGDALTASLVTAPVNGTVVLNADGSFTYTPNVNYNGPDSLIYQVCDNGTPSLCDTATVVFNVSAVNDNPVAVRDSVDVDEDTPATGNVLTNDSDPEGDAITASLVIAPVNGTVVLNADGSFTYTPNANYNGADSLVYQVCDSGTPSLCDTAAVVFSVTAVNDNPIAVRDSVDVDEDTPATGNVLTNDSDPEGDALTASLVTAPVNGTVVLNADGSFTYTPNTNYNGPDSLIYQVCDNGTPSLCDTATVVFNVTAANDSPIAVRDSVDVDEDVPASGNVLTNDSDPEGDALTASLVTAPVSGTVVLNADGSFTYTPNANYNGADSLVYQVCDNGTPSLCDTAIVVFDVAAVNDNPIAVRDSVDVDEDVPATGNVLTNDSDPEGDALTASLVTAPVNGTVVLNADGSFTYTPNTNYNGPDSLTYQVCDNGTPSLCDTATVVFNVAAVNDNPIAVRDSVDVDEDTPATGNVLTNDSDPEGDALTASLVTAPVNGTVVLNADGSFTYTPNVNYNGPDSLIYQVCDNGTPSLCDTATVVFNVTAVNDNPIAVRDSVDVDEDVPATGNVLTNDSDPEGDALTASLVTAPVNGTVVLNADGSFTYTPNVNYNGPDSLIYQVCDNGTPSLCDTATVVFNVTAVNDTPIAVRDSVDVDEDTPATGNVLTNDSDPEGDALTASLVTVPVNGTVVLNADGSFTYTPNADFSGRDSLIYQACDNGTPSLCDTATVVFNVAAVNDNPIAVRDTVDVDEDVSATGNVLTNDSDPEGDALTASLVTAPVNGTVVLNADGSFTYTPNDDFSGRDSLIYQVCDNGTPSRCDTATLIFNVSAANDAPIAVRDSINVTEDTPASGNVLTNDSDPEGDALTASLVTAPVSGTVVLNADGSFTYTPNANFTGVDSLIYQVCDNGTPSRCDTATVIFTIGSGNDAPIAVNDTIPVTEDTPASGNVLTNDNDPEGDALTASLVTAPVNGTVVLNADGSFTYTPNADFSGRDSLIYRICDNGAPSRCDTATVIFNIIGTNEPPIAVNDTFNIPSRATLNGNVLTNDTGPQGSSLTVSQISGTTNGTLQLNANGAFTYQSDSGFVGIDSFVYRACSGALCDTATVYINVIAVSGPRSAIGAALAAGTPVSQPDGSFRVTFTVRVQNYGNTVLSNLLAVYNLRNAFPLPVGFRIVGLNATNGLVVNTAYNGITDINLLLAQSGLAINGEGLITLVLDILPNGNFGPFLSSVQVRAQDPAGNEVSDISDNGTNPDPDGNDIPNEPDENVPTPVSFEIRELVGIAKAAAMPVLQINGDYHVTYTFVVRNMGNVAANNVQITDELTGVFTTPQTFRIVGDVRTTGGLLPNNQYNGSNASTLLAAGSTVAAGASDTVQVTVGVTPNKQFGTYNNSATLTAVADITGENLADVSTNGLEADPDDNGNPDENAVTPVTLAQTRIRIPEGFSPNNDGKNDRFVIGNVGSDKIDLEIYNRWGNVVYRNTDYKNNWDGKSNQGARFGEDVPDGTYYYIIIVNGTERFVNFITIMR